MPLVLVALLREYAYSADLPWLPKFQKKKVHLSKRLFNKLLHVICLPKSTIHSWNK